MEEEQLATTVRVLVTTGLVTGTIFAKQMSLRQQYRLVKSVGGHFRPQQSACGHIVRASAGLVNHVPQNKMLAVKVVQGTTGLVKPA